MDSRLKQRLIGAAVLVALAVIFLPMLVQGPAPDSGVSDLSLDLPAAPAGGGETRDLPLVAPGAAADGGAVLGDDRDDGELATVDTATADPAGDPTADPQPPTTAAGDYAVAFGTYGTQANAGTVVTRLRAEKLPAYAEPTSVYGKQAWRVRIGPFPARADAEAARVAASRLRSNVDAKVIALDAEAAAPAAGTATAATAAAQAAPAAAATPNPDAADPAPPRDRPAPAAQRPQSATAAATPPPRAEPRPATAPPTQAPAAPPATTPAQRPAAGAGFVVQLGAFNRPEEAAALQAKLRAAGVTAFTDSVETDKGRMTRVKAGPVVDRAEADRLQAQVRSKTGIDGFVRAYP